MHPLAARLLANLTPLCNAPTWYIAYSGGLDSTVLLHLLAQLAREQALPRLVALHVHHGLQTAADAWPAHCSRVCHGLGVPLQILRVTVEPGASLEQAARNARYGAFSSCLQAEELLLTAQHRDDQAETLLFRLLRGAGVRGLAAMPAQRRLGAGWLVRPLLDCPRSALLDYAQAHQLDWVEDPSNADTQLSRNYLRHTVLPSVHGRWPQASAALARSAGHLGEALELLDSLAEEDLLAARSPAPFAWLPLPSLALAPLRALSPARQRNALQHWLGAFTRLPDSRHWAGWAALRDAPDPANAVWRLTDGELRAGAGRIWWLAGPWLQVPGAPRGGQLPGNGQVEWQGPPGSPAAEVRYRQGGELIDLPGRGQRDLKRLLNESGLPSFVRPRLPLLFCEGRLQAVANLPSLCQSGWQMKWMPPTNAQCLS